MTHLSRAKELGLENKDIIHNPDDKSYKGFFPETNPTQILSFLSPDECEYIIKFFHTNLKNIGVTIKDILYFIHLPYSYPEIKEILKPKIDQMFPETFRYNEINSDSIKQSSDFILHQYGIFPPHTDSIIHIKNFVPYKDLLIPLDIDKDKQENAFYTCNQRYYGRATSFRYGKKDSMVALYSNTVRFQSYQEYGVEEIDYKNPMVVDFYENYLKNEDFPSSCWSGLSVNGIYDWIPGSCINFDPSIIHGPTNYKLKGVNWKTGITIRLFKNVVDYNPDTTFSRFSSKHGFQKVT